MSGARALLQRAGLWVRTGVGAWPALYCAIAAAKPGRNREVVSRHSHLTVEGFPRSGNTFVVAWLTAANPGLRCASHVHAPAHVRRSIHLGVPAVVLIRRAEDALASLKVRDPRIDVGVALERWVSFYRDIEKVRSHVAIVPFDDVTSDMEQVTQRLNAAFGLELRSRPHSDETEREVFALVDELSVRRFGVADPMAVSRPSPAREEIRTHNHTAVVDTAALARARELYARLARG